MPEERTYDLVGRRLALYAYLEPLLSGRRVLEIRPGRVHGREEEFVLAAEALVQDRLRDAGGLGDLARGGRVAAAAKQVAGDAQHLLARDRLGAGHASQCSRDRPAIQVGRLTNK